MPALVNEIFVLVHLVGMAILVGPFILNMKSKSNFPFGLMVVGATIQLVTGSALLGFAEMAAASGGDPVDHIKFTVKILLATGALIAAIIGNKRQKKGEMNLQPFFHTAGGFAVINLVIAVLWSAELWG
ncbi:MAG: hypothetical protein RLZZ319_503 [Actinomycetota bacterium]